MLMPAELQMINNTQCLDEFPKCYFEVMVFPVGLPTTPTHANPTQDSLCVHIRGNIVVFIVATNYLSPIFLKVFRN